MGRQLLTFKQYTGKSVNESSSPDALLTIDCSALRGVRTDEALYMKGTVLVNGRPLHVDISDKLYRKSATVLAAVLESFQGREFDAEEVYEELALVDNLEDEDYVLQADDLCHAVVAECLHPGVVSTFSVEDGTLRLVRTRNSGNIEHFEDLA